MPRSHNANLLLIGLRGSGKSTLGRELAIALGRPLIDLDEQTARSLNHPTAGDAFRTEGEPRFRLAEAAALARATETPAQVIALGGGTPTAPGASDFLSLCRAAGTAWVAYLHADPRPLRARLAHTDIAARPALLGGDPLDEIERVYAARDGLYRSLADVVIEVGPLGVARAVDAVLRAWRAPAPRA